MDKHNYEANARHEERQELGWTTQLEKIEQELDSVNVIHYRALPVEKQCEASCEIYFRSICPSVLFFYDIIT